MYAEDVWFSGKGRHIPIELHYENSTISYIKLDLHCIQITKVDHVVASTHALNTRNVQTEGKLAVQAC